MEKTITLKQVNDLVLVSDESIPKVIQLPVIDFSGIFKMSEKIDLIADYMFEQEVTEDNLAENRKLVARVRKAVNEYDTARKEIQKEINKPISELKIGIDDLTQKVTMAEDFIREQIRDIEEKQRQEKRDTLENKFNRRINHFPYSEFIKFEDFLQPRHLNKTTTIKKAETEMAQWINQRNTDLNILVGMAKEKRIEPTDYILAYQTNGYDLTRTLEKINHKQKVREQIKESLKKAEEHPMNEPRRSQEEYVTYLIRKGKDSKLLEMLMKENEIEFIKEGE